jgi:hypothetical protein
MEEVPTQLLDMLVCPKCRAKIRQTANGLVCTNKSCRLVYPMRDGIPIMLIEEAVLSNDNGA